MSDGLNVLAASNPYVEPVAHASGSLNRSVEHRVLDIMNDLKFAVFGTGFWARYQLAAWREIEGAQCVALYNRTKSKAEVLARDFDVASVYDNAEELLQTEKLDFVDIITDVETHKPFVELCAKYRVPVI